MMEKWTEKSLEELGAFSKGSGVTRADSNSGKLPCIRYGEIYTTHNDYIKTFTSFISPEVAKTAKLLKQGDLLFSGSGETKEEIGKCVAFIGGFEAYAGGDIIILSPNCEVDSLFMGFMLNTLSVNNQKTSKGQGDAVVHITAKSLADITVKIPPLIEQRAIAAALSDADAYIVALEKLIAKKRAVKQGAMQELLTGKRRLPGFSGAWVKKPLREIADDIIMGQSPGSRYYNNINDGLPLVQGNADIVNRNTIKRFYTSVVTKRGCKGDIIITVRAPVGNVAMTCFDCCLGRGVCALKGNGFLYQLLVYFEPQWGTVSAGSTFDSINGNELREVMFVIPTEKSEQTAIAEILSDMDAEIDALSAKLNKARQIKQGMMQELLTGKIRLVEQDVPVKAVAAVSAPKAVEKPKAENKKHSQQFDDAVMIAGIVNELYSDKFPLGRKKVQKCLYLLRRHQDESTAAFKKKAAGPYADEVRYKGGEPIAKDNQYISTTTVKGKGTTFARGENLNKALTYIELWGKQDDIKWVGEKLKFKRVDELELLATVDMAICDLEEAGTPVSVASIKHLIATNAEWKAKLEKQTFSDSNIDRAIYDLQLLLQGRK